MKRPSTAYRVAIMLMLAVLLSTLVGGYSPQTAQAGPVNKQDVFVHLFEWKWTDIAKECPRLAQSGYTAVQVSPPNVHAIVGQGTPAVIYNAQHEDTGFTTQFPWWERYQPVKHELGTSRSGTLQQFQDMVDTCKQAGIGIYVDAVINHMTNADSTWVSSDPSVNSDFSFGAHTKYNYPQYGGFGADKDFHLDNNPNQFSSHQDPTCNITDQKNFDLLRIQSGDYDPNPDNRVRMCELDYLADLRTDQEYVRTTLANYMIDMAKRGVKGFRIDGAKHMNPEDIAAIVDKVNAVVDPNPVYYLEVIDFAPHNQAIKASDYYNNSTLASAGVQVHEFVWEQLLSKNFLHADGDLIDFKNLNLDDPNSVAGFGLMPSEDAVIFVDNHDEQRGTAGSNVISAVTYRDRAVYKLANVFTLAYPYGAQVQIMSSYAAGSATGAPGEKDKVIAWTDKAMGPPSDSQGNTHNIWDGDGCQNSNALLNSMSGSYGSGTGQIPTSGWLCEHRNLAIEHMVQFRNYVADAPLKNFQMLNGDKNAIAFNRGDKGWVAINNNDYPITVSNFSINLPEGDYCDVIHTTYTDLWAVKACQDAGAHPEYIIHVNNVGQASLTIPARNAVAIYTGASGNFLTCVAETAGKKIGESQGIAPEKIEKTLDQLRSFRDTVMASTETGQKLTDQYYQYSPEMIRVLLDDEKLMSQTWDALNWIAPALERNANLQSNREDVFTKDRYYQLSMVLNAFEKGTKDPEFSRLIAGYRDRFNLERYIDMPMDTVVKEAVSVFNLTRER